MANAPNIDLAEQIARVRRSIEETENFVAEQHKLMAQAAQFERDHLFRPGRIVAASVAATVGLFGAGAALIKLIGSCA